jgi:murein DD-endopeptidase MepM/ murein hydrolase activator NlpD
VAGKPVVSLDHGGGLRTTYEPVSATVRVGEWVTTGQVIGHLVAGHPGCPVEACLHWGARLAAGDPTGDDDDYVDPMSLLLAAERAIGLKPTLPGDGAA